MTHSGSEGLPQNLKESVFFSRPAIAIFKEVGGESPEAFKKLVKDELWADACRWLATHFPLQYAIFWGLLCTEDSAKSSEPDELKSLVLDWVVNVSELTRSKILAITWLDVPENPVEYLAKAVAWTGPSMTPPQLPAVPADPVILGRLVAACVELSASKHADLDINNALKRFVGLARLIDTGEIHWAKSYNDKDAQILIQERPRSVFQSTFTT